MLPFVVVGLMLVQTKLFAPPATTPEAEMQQKMMKYMMVFMGVMFYKVPSGLGIYFITSSLWAIGERLLLPKVTHAQPALGGGAAEPASRRRRRSRGRGPRNGDRPARAAGKGDGDGNGDEGQAARPVRPVLETRPRRSPQRPDLPQDRRRARRQASDDKDRDRDRDRDRPRPKPRRR